MENEVIGDAKAITKKYKGGRPKKEVKQDEFIGVKCSLNEKTILKQKAEIAGLSLSEFLRETSLRGQAVTQIKALPKTNIVFDFKCIEGWSQKTWWSGVKFSDFGNYYHLNDEVKLNYAGLATPDKQYYVGIDMPSMVQPQTLLCYEMNGKPLPLNQGYPLRLIIPVKYGIKHLKRIGTIYFSDQKPPDFWAERGYDYYAGH